MNRLPKVLGAAAALALVGWVAYGAADRVYLAPRAELTASVADRAAMLERANRAIDDALRVDEGLRAYDARTLGGDAETVDHRLRTRLNRIAEAVGLERAVVSTGVADVVRSPAHGAFSRRGAWKTLRDEPDFVELTGSVSGAGTMAAVVQLVDRIDAEPWLKRIDRVKIDPKNVGDRFAVGVRVTTLFRPGRDPGEPAPSAYDQTTRLARYAALLDVSPFRLPPPAPEVAPEPEPAPETARPPGFPWHQWVLTGVAAGPSGPEAWVRSTADGAARRLAIGDGIGPAVLASIVAERAEFRIGPRRFRVRVGENFNDRTQVNE